MVRAGEVLVLPHQACCEVSANIRLDSCGRRSSSPPQFFPAQLSDSALSLPPSSPTLHHDCGPSPGLKPPSLPFTPRQKTSSELLHHNGGPGLTAEANDTVHGFFAVPEHLVLRHLSSHPRKKAALASVDQGG